MAILYDHDWLGDVGGTGRKQNTDMYFDRNLGAQIEFPATMPNERRNELVYGLYQQKQMDSMRGLGFLGQTALGYVEPQQPTYATTSPAAAYAMTPEMYQAQMASQQDVLNRQAQESFIAKEKQKDRDERNAVELANQHAQLRRDLAAEKFRADQLKLEEARFDLEDKRQAFEERKAAREAKMREEELALKTRVFGHTVTNDDTQNWMRWQQMENEKLWHEQQEARRTAEGSMINLGQGMGTANVVYNERDNRWEIRPFHGMESIFSATQGDEEPKYQSRATERVLKFDSDIAQLVDTLAMEANTSPNLIYAIMLQESGGNRNATSNKNAQGLMQLMPGTAKELGVTDSYDIKQNIRGGIEYFMKMLQRYNGDIPLALYAYWQGPGNADKDKKVDGFDPTNRGYVANVMQTFADLENDTFLNAGGMRVNGKEYYPADEDKEYWFYFKPNGEREYINKKQMDYEMTRGSRAEESIKDAMMIQAEDSDFDMTDSQGNIDYTPLKDAADIAGFITDYSSQGDVQQGEGNHEIIPSPPSMLSNPKEYDAWAKTWFPIYEFMNNTEKMNAADAVDKLSELIAELPEQYRQDITEKIGIIIEEEEKEKQSQGKPKTKVENKNTTDLHRYPAGFGIIGSNDRPAPPPPGPVSAGKNPDQEPWQKGTLGKNMQVSDLPEGGATLNVDGYFATVYKTGEIEWHYDEKGNKIPVPKRDN